MAFGNPSESCLCERYSITNHLNAAQASFLRALNWCRYMMVSLVRRPFQSWDMVGVTVSALCVAHCIILPFAFAVLPALQITFPEQEWLHLLLVGLSFVVMALALLQGWRKHGRLVPVCLAFVGLTLLAASVLAVETESAEKLVTGLGAVLTASAHFWNWSLLRREAADCPCCDSV